MALVGVVALAWGVLTSPAHAHTEILRAVPGPGESAEVGLGSLVVTFLDPVAPDASVTITGPDGRPVTTSAPQLDADRRQLDTSFAPLDDLGDYEVTVAFMAPDGARQSSVYRFTLVRPDRPETSRTSIGVAVVVGLVLAGGFGLAIHRRRATSVSHGHYETK